MKNIHKVLEKVDEGLLELFEMVSDSEKVSDGDIRDFAKFMRKYEEIIANLNNEEKQDITTSTGEQRPMEVGAADVHQAS